MNKTTSQGQAKNSPPEKTVVFQCPYCADGQMRLKEGFFRCNQCNSKISREEGIKRVKEALKRIQEEDKFGVKKEEKLIPKGVTIK